MAVFVLGGVVGIFGEIAELWMESTRRCSGLSNNKYYGERTGAVKRNKYDLSIRPKGGACHLT